MHRHNTNAVCVCVCVCAQCHSPGVSGGAAEEFRRHAGADAGRKGLSGYWLPPGEGEPNAAVLNNTRENCQF